MILLALGFEKNLLYPYYISSSSDCGMDSSMFSQVEQINLAFILRFLLFYCDDIDEADTRTVSVI